MKDKTAAGVTYRASELLRSRHGFSTRLGGVSEGIWQGLNLGVRTADRRDCVEENWRRFYAALDIDAPRRMHGLQVHGAAVKLVEPGEGFGLFEERPLTGYDAFVTNVPGIPLVVYTADCVPVLLEDFEAGIVAAVHGGWRGTAADIFARAVESMCSLGASPRRICAAVGPCIGPECFQTGPEVVSAFSALLSGRTEGLYRRDEAAAEERYLTDLPGVVMRRLQQLGLLREHIDGPDECTMCHPGKYWSHRRLGTARGSQASLIML